jgi:hypothetical protein
MPSFIYHLLLFCFLVSEGFSGQHNLKNEKFIPRFMEDFRDVKIEKSIARFLGASYASFISSSSLDVPNRSIWYKQSLTIEKKNS